MRFILRAAGALFAFAGLSLIVALGAQWLEPMEMQLMQAILALRNPPLTTLIQIVTYITSAVPCALFMGFVSLALLRRAALSLPHKPIWGYWRQLWPGLIFAGAIGSNIAVRIWLGRLPPQVEYLPTLLPEIYAGFHRYSFPSGHAGTALVTYVSAVLVAQNVFPLSAQRIRTRMAVVAALIIVGTGFGRVYLGVHWPTDVLGGYMLALFWVYMGCWLKNSCGVRQE